MRILPGPEDCDVFSFVSGVPHNLLQKCIFFFAKYVRKNQGETKKTCEIAMKNLGET